MASTLLNVPLPPKGRIEPLRRPSRAFPGGFAGAQGDRVWKPEELALLGTMPDPVVAHEGGRIGRMDIGDAGQGRLIGPPGCFARTRFGPLEGHVALVELLTALRREFLPELEVSDDGGYWETRDVAELARSHAQVRR